MSLLDNEKLNREVSIFQPDWKSVFELEIECLK